MGTPYEIERKWLLTDVDEVRLGAEAASRSRIEQTYLLDPQGGAERVRRREVHDAAGVRLQLTHTRKVAVSAGVVEEYEREVTEDEYADLLGRRDPARRTVVKTRWVVPWGGRVVEVDRITEPRSLWLAEVELSSTDDLAVEVALPAWLGPASEVTGDPAYANRMIALPPA